MAAIAPSFNEEKVYKTDLLTSLISIVFEEFLKIPDPKNSSKEIKIPLADHLMSGLAVFCLKNPSLLEFDRNRKDIFIRQNLKTLFHIQTPPSDTYLRERLDEVDPKYLRSAFKKLFSFLQNKKALKEFKFLGEYYILSIDGTGKFFSGKISCDNCCKKEYENGKVEYFHQLQGGCIVHPDKSNVIPICPEEIKNFDGDSKNDCERNASKRVIEKFSKEHPHLKVIVVEDGLFSNGPHIKHLESHRMKYIIGAKPGDHQFLFDRVDNSGSTKYFEYEDENGSLHQFRYLNNVQLNKSHPDLMVNFIEYRETDNKGIEYNFSWITNIKVSESNIYKLMRGGRARWKIENETYNTLKNLGYNFEHNYGHGKKHLSSVFSLLAMLSFLIDQIQGMLCDLFKAAKEKAGTYCGLWNRMGVLFEFVELTSWEALYLVIAKKRKLRLDSS